MSEVKSDIQIAREAKMQPIKEILEKVNVPDESFKGFIVFNLTLF